MSFTHVALTQYSNNPENFPLRALGPNLQQVVCEIQQETSAPISSIVSALITAISLVCQGKIRVRKRKQLVSPVSLWFIVVQESGERKSTVIKLILKAVYDYLSKNSATHARLLEDYEARYDIWKSKYRGLQRKIQQNASLGKTVEEEQAALILHNAEKPVKPKGLKLIHENTTPSALLKNMAEYFSTTALLSDEGHTIFNSRAMSDLGILNKAWDGGSIHVDRVSEGELVINDPSITLGLFVQNDVFQHYLQGNGALARASGLLARGYVVQPPSSIGSRYLANATEGSHEAITGFQGRCIEILEAHHGADNTKLPEKITLLFSADAQSRWEQEHDEIEFMMKPSGQLQNFKDFGSKHADKIARLSALLHYFEGKDGPILLETLERSIAISNWFGAEFIRFFTPPPQPSKEHMEASLLVQWLANQYCLTGSCVFKKNEVRKSGPNPLRNKNSLNSATMYLIQRGIIFEGRLPNEKTIYINLIIQFFNQNLLVLCQHGLPTR